MAHSPESDSMHPAGKLPPTLTPTGQFSGKPTLPISRSVTLLGSRKQARLQLISSSVSQNHALIVNANSGPYVRDLASREHTLVNGVEVKEGALNDGDEIQVGRFTFRFNQPPQSRPVDAISEITTAPAAGIQIDGEEGVRPFDGKSILIGRRDGCDIHIPDKGVSTTHAIIFEMDGRRYLRDLASRTGTLVNGKPVHQVELDPNDEISIAGVIMRYVTEEAMEAAVPEVGFDELAAAPDELMAPAEDLAAPARDAVETDEAAIPLAGEEDIAAEQEAAAEEAEPSEPDIGPIEIEADLDAVPDLRKAAPLQDEAAQIEPAEVEPAEVEPAELEPEEPLALEPVTRAPQPAPPRPAPPRPAQPMPAEPAELTPADLDASKDESGVDVTDSDAQRAPASASLGELKAEDLDIPEEPREVSVDDLLGLAPDAPAPDTAVPTSGARDAGRDTPRRKTKEVFSEIRPADDESAPDEREQQAQPAEAIPPVPDSVEADAEALADEVLGLEPAAPPTEQPATPPAPSPKFAPGASQLELTPVEEIEARSEPQEPDRVQPQAERELRIDSDSEPAESTATDWPTPVEFDSDEMDEIAGLAAPGAPVDQASGVEQPPAAPLMEAALDQAAFRAEQVQADDLDIAPDESFDSIEARHQEAPSDLRLGAPGEATDRESGVFEIGQPAAEPPAGEAAPAPLEAIEVEQTTELPRDEAKQQEDEPPAIELAAEAPPTADDAGAQAQRESALADTIVGEQAPVVEMEDAAPAEPAAKPKRGSKRGGASGRKPTRRGPKKKSDPAAPIAESIPADSPVGEPPMITADDSRPVTETAATVASAGAAAAAAEADAIAPRADEPASQDVRSDQEPATQEPATPEPTAPEPTVGSPAEQAAEMEGQAPAESSQEVETDEIEVLAQTDATPASALPLDESVEPAAGRDERPAADAVPLSDSSFGRAMEELAADSGPIVEDPVARAPRAEPLENRAPAEARVNDDIALEMLSGASPAAGEGPGAAAPLELDTASAAETSAPEPEKLFNLPAGTAPSAPPVHPERSTPSATPDEVELALEPSAELKHAAPQDTRKPKAADRDRTAEPPRPVEPQRDAPRSGASRYAPGSSQLDLEPVDESELRATAPDAGSDQADELALEAIAEAPTPTSAKTPPRGEGPATEEPSYNWGANQEHFLGGMPLKLGGGTAQSTPAGPLPRPTPATPATPAAPTAPAQRTPAARAPLTDDAIGESSPAGRPAPGRQPQGLPPRPAPRRGGTFAGGRPLPFAGSDPSAPQVTTGFDGLAMPPVREADVFAPMQSGLTGGIAPGAMNDIFSQGARRGMPTPQPQPGGTSAPASAPAAAPRRATRSQPPGDALTGAGALSSPGMATEPASGKTLRSAGGHQRPPATPVAPVQTEAPPRKKRRWFGLRMLLIALAVPSALGAGAAAYYLMPNRAVVRGELKFENFQKLPQRDRVPLEGEQRELLADPSVRDAAQRKLAEIDASLSPGFLRGGVELARIRSEAKMDMESGTLTLPMAGAARGDETRMFALLQAMYDANGDRARKSVELAGVLDNLKRQREQSTKRLEELKAQIDKLASVAQAAPSAAEREKASAEVKRLQAEWNASDLAVAALTRELEQLQATPVAAASATPPAPADNAAADVGASAAGPDAELAALEKELAEVRAEIASLQEADKGGLTAAGDRLESALGALAKRLEAAREGAGDSPAFAAYLEQATGVVDRAREQTAEFVKRQSEQIARLVETEASLAQKKLARRAEVASRDPELATLLDQRDLKTRQYNAAQGDENLKAEAAEIKTELNFLQSMIAARQTRVADDGFNADAIDQLERIADATRREIDADRRESSEMISQLQAELAGGRADGFSPAQTESATSLESGLADLATARKQFVAASDAATLEEAQQSAGLQAKATELSRTITARQAEVAAAQATAPAVQAGNTSAPQAADPADPAAEQAARVEAKSAELADAQQRHESAKKAYLAAQEKLATLTEQANRAREAGEERDRLALQRDAEQQTLKMNAAQFESRKKEAEMLAYPAIPAPGDVTAAKHVDRRQVYSLAAFGGVAALFSLGILLTGGAREGSAPIDASQDEESAASEPIVERPVDPQAAAESPAARVAEV